MAVRHNKHESASLFLLLRLSQDPVKMPRVELPVMTVYRHVASLGRRVNHCALNHDTVTVAGRRNPLRHRTVVLPIGVVGVGGFSCA
jgi:hypothetical protein